MLIKDLKEVMEDSESPIEQRAMALARIDCEYEMRGTIERYHREQDELLDQLDEFKGIEQHRNKLLKQVESLNLQVMWLQLHNKELASKYTKAYDLNKRLMIENYQSSNDSVSMT